MMNDQAMREIINYEYMIYGTPKFIGEPVSEFWEIHKVFHSWLSNGSHNFIVVLRRPYPKPQADGGGDENI